MMRFVESGYAGEVFDGNVAAGATACGNAGCGIRVLGLDLDGQPAGRGFAVSDTFDNT
jgi:hypothetical protein